MATTTDLTLADVDLSNLDTFVDRVPFDQFELLRREAPVYLHPGGDLFPPYWCITKHADIRAISADWTSPRQNSSSAGPMTVASRSAISSRGRMVRSV